ncbi:MAG TPA: hypothetical protein VNH65_08045 [Candidatus Acidoferrum sp.]|nr:hypothetical protein [Candidatus Acidoferrum sp.]
MATGVSRAQEATPPPPEKMKVMRQGGAPGEGGPFGERMELLGFEGMHGGKVITGAPFSAVAISESTQSLSDGNNITRKTQTTLYRDSQGRFRKEVNFSAVGLLAEPRQPRSVVLIQDPVAKVGYLLEPDQKIARTMSFGGRVPPPNGMARDRRNNRLQKELADGSLKQEALGTQVISGVTATGTRYTHTIPAGQIGNEKAIVIVSERWYSDELQMVLKSTRSDPRFGTSTYTVTNIQRTEPAAALFIVPADYTVQAGGRGHGRRGAMPPPPPPSDN